MFAEQAAILPKLFERRQVRLIEQIRYDRKVIAAKMNAEVLRSGAFVVAVSKAYVAKYEEFAHGLINETLDLFRRSGIAFDHQSAEWIRAKVGHYLEVGDRNVRGEAEGGKILHNEIKENVGHAMDQALNRMRRDLEIELLDLALVAKPTSESDVVQPIQEFVDALVDLQDRRGAERDFVEFTAKVDEPLCLVLFDIDRFKDVNDKHGGHAIGDDAPQGGG